MPFWPIYPVSHTNGVESQVVSLLQELGIYIKDARDALKGQVYYAGGKENGRFFRLANGLYVIPDFKVKGAKKVIEVYGDYWHSREFCEKFGFPEYKWSAQAIIAEYANVGITCLVFWESELLNPELHESIKEQILAFVAQGEQQAIALMQIPMEEEAAPGTLGTVPSVSTTV